MSERNFTAAMDAAIVAGTVRPALFYEGEFASSQFLRLWTGVGQIDWDGHTWTGGGHLLVITPLEERRDVKAIVFTVSVSGMPSANISLALASVRQNKPGNLWLGLFNAAGALIADPYQPRNGRFDVAGIDDDGQTCTIAAQYEDRLVDLDRARERRYTHEDQQIDWPGDLGFEYVESLQDMQLLWGGPGAAASSLAAPSAGAPGAAGSAGVESSPMAAPAPAPEHEYGPALDSSD